MVKKITVVIFLGLILLIPGILDASSGETTPAQVEDLSDRNYFPRILDLLKNSRESIEISQYQILMAPVDASHPVTQILQAIAEAKARGVRVRVLLNRRLDYDAGDTVPLARSLAAVDFLRGRGIEVVFADPSQRLHDKVTVIDGRYVIQGSTNWTRTALLSNWESSALIDSPAYAKAILARIHSIPPAQVQSLDALEEEGPAVKIPAILMTDKNDFPGMLEDKDEKIFEFYLWLLKETSVSFPHALGGNPPGLKLGSPTKSLGDDIRLQLNDETLFRVFRLDPAKSQKDKRREAVRLLKKLEQQKRIKLNISSPGADVKIHINRNLSAATVALPISYFEYGYPARLSFAAEFFYLISRLEVSESPSAPWWWRSEEYLSAKYHIHHTTLAAGMLELQRENLIEIVRDDAPEGRPFEERLVNRYRMNSMKDPKGQEKRFQALAEKFGAEKLNQARRYADAVEEPQAPEAAALILQWMRVYPPASLEAAFQQVAGYERNNPRHSLHYIKEVLEAPRRTVSE